MKKFVKAMVTCLAALAIVLGSVSVSASAKVGDRNENKKPAPVDKSIVFRYVTSPDQSVSVDKNTVKFTVELVDGESITLYTGDAFNGITENKEANADAVFQKLSIDGYKYDKCYFNWAGDNSGDKVEVKQFRNMEKKSNLGYESLIGFRTKEDKKDSKDYEGKGVEAEYYAYNPTGTLMVVFAKKAAPAEPVNPNPVPVNPPAGKDEQSVSLNYYVRLVDPENFIDETTEREYKGYDSSNYSSSLGDATVSISKDHVKAMKAVFANESNGGAAGSVEDKVAELVKGNALSLSDDEIRTKLATVTFDPNMIYSIDWYVCKLDSNDGIHVDGKLVATQKTVTDNQDDTDDTDDTDDNGDEGESQNPTVVTGGAIEVPVTPENPTGDQEDNDPSEGQTEPVVPAKEEVKNTYVPVVLPPQTEEEVAEEIIDVNEEVETPEGAAEVEEVETVEEEVDTDDNEEPAVENIDVVETETPEALPQTGTTANVVFYILGSLFMAAGAALVFKKRI